MSANVLLHAPRHDAPFPLTVRGAVQDGGTAALTLNVIGGFGASFFTQNPKHLRELATVAADLADRLESAQVVASYAKPVTA